MVLLNCCFSYASRWQLRDKVISLVLKEVTAGQILQQMLLQFTKRNVVFLLDLLMTLWPVRSFLLVRICFMKSVAIPTNWLLQTTRETRQDTIGRNYSTVMVLVLSRIISLQISSLISNGIVIKQTIIDSLIQNYTSFINEINELTAQQLLFSKGEKWTAGKQFRKWLNC